VIGLFVIDGLGLVLLSIFIDWDFIL